ncbi:thioesterase [Luteitalea sp. TBR-22]|uniref:acyl-CoA thioesterase n=1 Tax=Luteitalea sp. TBR-22 TaxID=2802971 RepID=UPI001AF2AF7D|nr:thioesterase family protein [Luteitalea sp. TBR-22]BCS35771.1 thioesterase [Luteitalea sp. TBR-22]
MSGPTFRFATTLRVRWGDCDAFGHVNNASYLTFFEEARIDYWKAVVPDVPFTGMAIVHSSVDFKGQAYPGDILTIRAAVTELRKTSFWAAYEVLRGEQVVATGTSAQVFFDYATQRPAPIPEAFRERVASYEGISSTAT